MEKPCHRVRVSSPGEEASRRHQMAGALPLEMEAKAAFVQLGVEVDVLELEDGNRPRLHGSVLVPSETVRAMGRGVMGPRGFVRPRAR